MIGENKWFFGFLLIASIVVGVLIWNMPDRLEVGDTSLFTGGETKYSPNIDDAAEYYPPMRVLIIEQSDSWYRVQSDDGTIIRWVSIFSLIDENVVGKAVYVERSIRGYDALEDNPSYTEISTGSYSVIGWGVVNDGLYFQVKTETSTVAYWVSASDLTNTTDVNAGYQQ